MLRSMIVLDINVLSELMRPEPSAAVEHWLAEQPAVSLFISAITEAELRYGLALLPHGKRRAKLLVEAEAMLVEDFAGRILPFDSPAASAYAQIASERAQRALEVDAAERLSRTAVARVAQGLTDQRPELTARESWTDQRDALLQLDAAALSADIGLQRALGGGYEKDQKAP